MLETAAGIYRDGPTLAKAADQIRVLNNTYAGGEGCFDTGFSFVLAGLGTFSNFFGLIGQQP